MIVSGEALEMGVPGHVTIYVHSLCNSRRSFDLLCCSALKLQNIFMLNKLYL